MENVLGISLQIQLPNFSLESYLVNVSESRTYTVSEYGNCEIRKLCFQLRHRFRIFSMKVM